MTMLSQGASMHASATSSQPADASVEAPIRVMIVDDSAVVRGLVSRWIEEEPGPRSRVARHANGKLAVDDVARSAPDIVLLDIEMPVMDGLEALPLLLAGAARLRVLMVSTLTKRNAEISFKALALGALDYVPKPDSNREITISLGFPPRGDPQDQGARPGAHPARGSGEGAPGAADRAAAVEAGKRTAFTQRPFSLVPPRIIAIGSSTGGPQALGQSARGRSPVAVPRSGAGRAAYAADVHHASWPSAWRGPPGARPSEGTRRRDGSSRARSMWRRATIT